MSYLNTQKLHHDHHIHQSKDDERDLSHRYIYLNNNILEASFLLIKHILQ